MKNNITRISSPTPYSVGDVNLYFIHDKDSPTLIDTGIGSKGLTTLTNELKKINYEIADIRRCIITHAHTDHMNLLDRLSPSTEVFIHPFDLQSIIKLPDEEIKKHMSSLKQLLYAAGVDDDSVESIFSFISNFIAHQTLNITHAQPVEENYLFTFSHSTLKVIETPGHTPGCISLWDEQEKILFSGDHILPDITPNPLIQIIDPDPEYKSLIAYQDSLQKILSLNPLIIYPGHGEPITQPQKVIHNIFKHHEARTTRLLKLLRKKEYTIYELSQELFGDLGGFNIILGLSEVKAHLEYLEKQNQLNISQDDLLLRYSSKI